MLIKIQSMSVRGAVRQLLLRHPPASAIHVQRTVRFDDVNVEPDECVEMCARAGRGAGPPEFPGRIGVYYSWWDSGLPFSRSIIMVEGDDPRVQSFLAFDLAERADWWEGIPLYVLGADCYTLPWILAHAAGRIRVDGKAPIEWRHAINRYTSTAKQIVATINRAGIHHRHRGNILCSLAREIVPDL